jgi:GntR family transcriptional regulator, transcriptional repressor for pyruvate dehydrogenase complex
MDHLKKSRAGARRRAADSVESACRRIERNIKLGLWKTGHQLPTERALQAELGVARNTLRRGLKRLEREGSIVRHVGRGTFVAELKAAEPQNFLERLNGCSPSEVMEVRLMMEPKAAELAAARASQTELQFLEDCLKGAGSAADLPTFEHWDGLLHKTIIGATKNELLIGLYEAINAIRNQAEWTRLKERAVTPQRRTLYHKQHTELVAAIRERDARAARRRMRAHLLAVRANLFKK